jgi:hypothetical protein
MGAPSAAGRRLQRRSMHSLGACARHGLLACLWSPNIRLRHVRHSFYCGLPIKKLGWCRPTLRSPEASSLSFISARRFVNLPHQDRERRALEPLHLPHNVVQPCVATRCDHPHDVTCICSMALRSAIQAVGDTPAQIVAAIRRAVSISEKAPKAVAYASRGRGERTRPSTVWRASRPASSRSCAWSRKDFPTPRSGSALHLQAYGAEPISSTSSPSWA